MCNVIIPVNVTLIIFYIIIIWHVMKCDLGNVIITYCNYNA